MRQTELHLSPDDRLTVQAIRAKGTRSAREVNPAYILLALDRRIPEVQVMAVLGVGRMIIWRTRAAYLDGVAWIWRCATRSARGDHVSRHPSRGPRGGTGLLASPNGQYALDSATVARRGARRARFHYMPKHASWLNMAEIEIGVLARQCLNTRFDTRDTLERHVQAW